MTDTASSAFEQSAYSPIDDLLAFENTDPQWVGRFDLNLEYTVQCFNPLGIPAGATITAATFSWISGGTDTDGDYNDLRWTLDFGTADTHPTDSPNDSDWIEVTPVTGHPADIVGGDQIVAGGGQYNGSVDFIDAMQAMVDLAGWDEDSGVLALLAPTDDNIDGTDMLVPLADIVVTYTSGGSTNTIHVGASTPSAIMLGTSTVSAVYIGTNQVWP